MKKLEVIGIETISIDKQLQNLPNPLLNTLYEFIAKSYHVADQEEFNLYFLKPEEAGELTILFGLNDEIAGLIRTTQQTINVSKKTVTAYIASMFFNPKYKINPSVSNFGLQSAIEYKLANPQQELVYLTFANTPFTYELLNQLSDILYPKIEQTIPEQVMTVFNAIKNHNGWKTTNHHPWVVSSPLVPIRGEASHCYNEAAEHSEFYLSANPDFMQGNSLLVFIPLHLANISYGLNHSEVINPHKPGGRPPHQSWISTNQ
jgi:hypothetical protein